MTNVAAYNMEYVIVVQKNALRCSDCKALQQHNGIADCGVRRPASILDSSARIPQFAGEA